MLDLRASLNAASAAGALRRVSFRPDAANDFMHSSCLRELVESGQVSNEQVSSLVLARTRSFYTYPSEATVTIPVTTVPLPFSTAELSRNSTGDFATSWNSDFL